MAVLLECPFCHRRQSSRSKLCLSKGGKGCGADLEKARKSGKIKYWIAYRLPGGKQRFEKLTGDNASSIEYAKDADSKRKVQKREKRIFDIKPESTMTFKELSDWYLSLESVKAKASFSTKRINLNSFNKELGQTLVMDIKPEALENYQAKRKGQGLSDAYVDNEIGEARTVINKAFDNDMIGGECLRVFKKVRKLLKRNSNVRDKVISAEQFQGLMEKLPEHAQAIVAMGFYTGMRRGEIVSLTWDRIDLGNRFIYLSAKDTKDREPRKIPICDELSEILAAIPRAVHDDHVFLYRGKPVRDIRKTLEKACTETGIKYGRLPKDGFTFHGFRHTFNTLMRKSGVSESVIMLITGHSTREMFDRYNTIDAEDMVGAVNIMGKFLKNGIRPANVDQNVDQSWN